MIAKHERVEVVVRAFRPEDRGRVAVLLSRLSPGSIYHRFHCGGLQVDSVMLDSVTSGQAQVAELDGCLVGLASCANADDQRRAELGVVVDDASQRRGIGRALCRELLLDAELAGIRRVVASVMRSNHAMLRLLQVLDLPLLYTGRGSILEVAIQLGGGA